MKSATYYTSHFIWAKSKVLHFDSTHAGSWLREWYESDWVAIVCWQQRSYFFLEVHSLHVQRLAQCRACLFWGKCICLFWNNYYLLYCPVKSDILSFHFHNHLSDRSFALLSRAMVSSCQARPSVRIVLMMEEGTPKQSCAKSTSIHFVWLRCRCSNYWEWKEHTCSWPCFWTWHFSSTWFYLAQVEAYQDAGCIACFKRWVLDDVFAELGNPLNTKKIWDGDVILTESLMLLSMLKQSCTNGAALILAHVDEG